jgi:PEP-CTERM motif
MIHCYKNSAEPKNPFKIISVRAGGSAPIKRMKNISFPKVVAVALSCVALQTPLLSHAAPVVLVDPTGPNSQAIVDPTSQAGMFAWNVDGVNQLNQQWFWYALGATAPRSIDTLGLAGLNQLAPNSLDTLYAGAGFNVDVKYILTGGAPGSGVSDIGETIRIQNMTGSALNFHFYQYSDFNLSGTPNGDSIDLSKNGQGMFNDAYQTKGALALTETVASPGANHGEAALAGVTLAELNNGVNPVTLSDVAFAGPGNVTWAFEWDLNIAGGGTAIISKDKYLQVTFVPEPATVGLISLGLLAGALYRRRTA